MIVNKYLCFLLLSFAVTTANAWTLFGRPSNYDECMLDAIKNKPSKTSGDDDYLTLGMINVSCRKLFPSKTEDTKNCSQRELTATEREKIQWNDVEVTLLSSEPYFSAKFYNGTKDKRIVAVTIKISPPAVPEPIDKNAKQKEFMFADLSFKPQEYEIVLTQAIEPKEIGKVGKTILKSPPKGWNWEVTSVKGCQ